MLLSLCLLIAATFSYHGNPWLRDYKVTLIPTGDNFFAVLGKFKDTVIQGTIDPENSVNVYVNKDMKLDSGSESKVKTDAVCSITDKSNKFDISCGVDDNNSYYIYIFSNKLGDVVLNIDSVKYAAVVIPILMLFVGIACAISVPFFRRKLKK